MRRQISAMRMQIIMIAILAATWFSLTVQAVPLTLQDQLNVALQKIAELKGDLFGSCCNISRITQDVFKTEEPESGIFDIPDVCTEQTNKFCNEVPKTQARCDFQNGGGWTVILRRNANVTQQVNFNCSWADYERGFGDLNTEFWYGLRNIHCLTEREEVELQIELRQYDGTGQVWTYGYFEVDGPETNYTLHIGQAQGPSDGYNSMAYHNGLQFSTTDRDNDVWPSNCASHFGGSGWWFKSCFHSLLTGIHSLRRLQWWIRFGYDEYYPFAEMRLRPKNCKTIEVCN